MTLGRPSLLADANHAHVKLSEDAGMLFHRGGKSCALADRIRNMQDHFFQGGIFLLLAQALQGLRNGDAPLQATCPFPG